MIFIAFAAAGSWARSRERTNECIPCPVTDGGASCEQAYMVEQLVTPIPPQITRQGSKETARVLPVPSADAFAPAQEIIRKYGISLTTCWVTTWSTSVTGC